MSIEHYWAACRLDIPPTQKSLLRLISMSYNAEHDRACYFNLETLAAYTSLNKSTIIRSTAWLEIMGLLVVARGGGRHGVNQYVPIPYPNNLVSAIKETVASRDRFSASAIKASIAPSNETVALRSETVAECSETVALCNPKDFKEKKEKEKPGTGAWGDKKPQRELEPYELPEYLASFSEKDASVVVMYHRHGKEKLAKFFDIENLERIAALIAEAQEQKRFGVERDCDSPATTATETAPTSVTSEETKAKAEVNHIAGAKAACPVFAHDSNVIPLNVAGYFKRPQTTAAEFRGLLIVGGITPEKADARIRDVAALGEFGAVQFMRQFITRHGESIRSTRKAQRTSGAIAAAVRHFKPDRQAA